MGRKVKSSAYAIRHSLVFYGKLSWRREDPGPARATPSHQAFKIPLNKHRFVPKLDSKFSRSVLYYWKHRGLLRLTSPIRPPKLETFTLTYRRIARVWRNMCVMLKKLCARMKKWGVGGKGEPDEKNLPIHPSKLESFTFNY